MYFKTPESALNWLATNMFDFENISNTLKLMNLLEIYTVFNSPDIYLVKETNEQSNTHKIFYSFDADNDIENMIITRTDLLKILKRIKDEDEKLYMIIHNYIQGGFWDAFGYCQRKTNELSSLRFYLIHMEKFADILHQSDYITKNDYNAYYDLAMVAYMQILNSKVDKNSKSG